MKTIYKYPLFIGTTSIQCPQCSTVLDVQKQNGVFQVWVQVDTSMPIESRTFRTYGTGHGLDDDPGDYIGTVQDDYFVWHFYEVTRTLNPERI